MVKLISCPNHSAFFDKNTTGSLLLQTIFSKLHYNQEIYSDEFPFMQSQTFLEPKTVMK